MENKSNALFIVAIFFLIGSIIFVNAYSIEPEYVHQHITNESGQVWSLLPYEIKQKLSTPLNQNLDSNYDIGDDIITGSGEEDIPVTNVLKHFWQPDDPNTVVYYVNLPGSYLTGLYGFESSYSKAKRIFHEKVIRLYQKGEIDEAYYWLGHVVHLLEDASVPAHVHLDPHLPIESQEDLLELYTAANFSRYNGSLYVGQQYNYESLPNLGSFNWNDVDAATNHKQYVELFRLFWFAAQRAQYFASNARDGNDAYNKTSGGAPVTFSPSLWQGETVTIINQQGEVPDRVNHISDAEVPHAMKAVAGLYRLFWEYAHTDWPTFHHDNRRMGFTTLKGDMTSVSRVNQLNLVLDSNVGQDHISRASVADIDNDGRQDVVIASSKIGGGMHDGDLFDSELTWRRGI